MHSELPSIESELLEPFAGGLTGQFEPVRLLHRDLGGYSWLALDRIHQAHVVLKVFTVTEPALRERVTRTQARLREVPNPFLAPAVLVGPHARGLFTVTPYLPGEALSERLSRGVLNVAEALSVGLGILHGLSEAHAAGVLHRDLKPSNVILAGGAPEHAVLVDWGLAASERFDLFQHGVPLDVVRYLAPEQAGLFGSPPGPTTDLYALGTLLFEALSGRAVFQGTSLTALLHQHLNQPVPSLRALGHRVPRALDELIGRLLQKDPLDRYQSARAALHDLRALAAALGRGEHEPAVVIGGEDERSGVAPPAFVGRRSELRELELGLEPAREGRGTLQVLEGEAGVGKSRLLQELSCQGALHGFTVFRGQPPMTPTPGHVRLLESLAQSILTVSRARPELARSLRERLRHEATALCASLPALTEPLRVTAATVLEATKPADELSVRALTKLLDALGTREHPALVVLDGAQWADPLTQRVLERWARGPVGAERHVALVVACRSGEEDGWTLPASAGASHLRLGALARDDLLALLASAAGPLPPAVREALVDEAAGNPSRALRGLLRWRDAAAGPRRHDGPYAPESPTPALVEQINQLLRLGHRVASALSWEGVEQSLREASGSVLKAEVSAVVPVAPAGPPHLARPLPPGAHLADAVRALESGGPVVGSMDGQAEVRSSLYVPIRVRGRAVACLVALHRRVHGLFDGHVVRMADCLATLAGVALENAESFASLEALSDERQRLYAKTRAALEAREDFLTIAAHELRTPLTSLQLQLQSARRLVRTQPEEAERKLEAAAARGRRLSQLVDELLDSTHLSQQQLALSPEPVDLAGLVREVVDRLAGNLEQAGCTLNLRTPPTLIGHWDRTRLEQVVTNLLSNAIKYGRGKPIHVTLREHPAVVQLVVRDEGMGIAPEDQQRIFERFERAVPVKHFGGFGIGLWLAQQVITAHGGNIQVNSQPGAGATFVVELPRSHLGASA